MYNATYLKRQRNNFHSEPTKYFCDLLISHEIGGGRGRGRGESHYKYQRSQTLSSQPHVM